MARDAFGKEEHRTSRGVSDTSAGGLGLNLYKAQEPRGGARGPRGGSLLCARRGRGSGGSHRKLPAVAGQGRHSLDQSLGGHVQLFERFCKRSPSKFPEGLLSLIQVPLQARASGMQGRSPVRTSRATVRHGVRDGCRIGM